MRALGTRVVGFGRFLYDFVIGDDWTVAVVMVAAVALTYLMAHHHVTAWWLPPLAVAGALTASVMRASRP